MNTTWPMSDAGARFTELVREAKAHGPQTVTDCGKRVVMVVAVDEFDRLNRPQRSLLAALRACPTKGEIDLDELRQPEAIRSLDILPGE